MQIASNNGLSKESKHIPITVEEPWIGDSGELLLLREMMHRINNELTSTISIFYGAAERTSNRNVKVALTNAIEHLYDHARVYRALQMPAANKSIDAAAYCESFANRSVVQSCSTTALSSYLSSTRFN